MIKEQVNATPAPPERFNHMTFRSSRIVYYGPHQCDNCGVMICKMGTEFGGNAFTYPEGPVYPNTEWHPHVCDPKRVKSLPCTLELPNAPAGTFIIPIKDGEYTSR